VTEGRRAALPPWLFPSLHGYRPDRLRSDLTAGLTVWAVLVPEALAYASIAGVSPVVGLYAAPAALVLYAAIGSSRHLVVGPMSATSALSAAAVAEIATRGSHDFVTLTATLAVVTGLLAIVAGLLRLGFAAAFISPPVLKGFIVGLALTIAISQLPKLLGVPAGSGGFFERGWDLGKHADDVGAATAAVGLGSLALIYALRRVARAVPAFLIVVAAGIVASKLLDLEQHGVAVVGHIAPGLPPVGLPDAPAGDALKLAASAAGLLLVAFAEGLAAAKAYAMRSGDTIDADRELIGVGLANLGAGLSSGMVVGGSLSKTAVNGEAGARTQLSGLVVAALTVVTLLVLTGLFEQLPEATLAAVVIAAVIDLIDVPGLLRLRRIWTHRLGRIYGPAARPDFLAALAALAGVLVFQTLAGLFIGIAMSLLVLAYRSSRPHVAVLGQVDGRWHDVDRHAGAVRVPGVAVLRIEGGVFFANADRVRDTVLGHAGAPGIHAVVIDAETVPSVDVTGARTFAELRATLARRAVTLVVARDVGQVEDVLRVAGDAELPLYPTVTAAVDAVRRPEPKSVVMRGG
jgi:SulP family sulfate permease